MKNKAKPKETLPKQLVSIQKEKIQLEAIIAAIGDAVSIQDTSFKILYQNQLHKDLTSDHLGEYCYRAYEKNDSPCPGCPLVMSFKDGEIHKADRSVSNEKGKLYVEITASSIKNEQGEIIAGIELVRNITERKHAEETLEFERAQLLSIFDSINEVIYIADPKTYEILYANKALKDKMGEDVVGDICYKRFQGRDAPCEFCTNEIILKEKDKPYQWEHHNPVIGRDYMLIDRIIKWPDGRDVRFELAIDITERKTAEKAIIEEESKFRSLVEQSLVGIYIIQDGRFQYVNTKIAEIFGYTQEEIISSKTVSDMVAEADRDLVAENIRKRLEGEAKSIHYTFQGKRKDGTLIDIEVLGTKMEHNGRPAIIGTLLDITERKKIEAELQKAQKLDSLGILAGGIAHDFNNILTAVIGNISLAKMYARPGYEIYDILTEAENASMRAKALTRQLMTFSKGGEPLKKTIFVGELITETCAFILKGTNIKCESYIQHNLKPIEADDGLISQVIANILINAIHAMPEGGIINVSAENKNITGQSNIPLKDGEYVKISIKDHGIGIQKEHLNKIFDPFFTTKQRGKGLGLTSSYSIVKNHNGYIGVESEPGKGTTFHVYLPVSKEQPSLKEIVQEFPFSAKGRILVMDDEDLLRTVISRMLAQCGYEAETSKDGSEMLKIYTEAMQSGKPFDAVIIDLIVPAGMGGKEAIQELLKIDPNAKAIVSSGYSEDPMIANFQEYGFRGMLAKPFTLNNLSQALHKLTH